MFCFVFFYFLFSLFSWLKTCSTDYYYCYSSWSMNSLDAFDRWQCVSLNPTSWWEPSLDAFGWLKRWNLLAVVVFVERLVWIAAVIVAADLNHLFLCCRYLPIKYFRKIDFRVSYGKNLQKWDEKLQISSYSSRTCNRG